MDPISWTICCIVTMIITIIVTITESLGDVLIIIMTRSMLIAGIHICNILKMDDDI